MLHHTLSILLESKLLEQVSVVSPDARVLEQAQAWGAQPLVEEHHDHNAALQAAALRRDLFARRGWSGAVGGGIPVLQTGCPPSAPALWNRRNSELLGRPPSASSNTQQALLTISADLPLLKRHYIHALIEQSCHYQVVLAPSRDGTGTNAILVRPPLAVPYLFGPNSLQRYLDAAEQRHLSSTLCKSSGLGFDVDTIED